MVDHDSFQCQYTTRASLRESRYRKEEVKKLRRKSFALVSFVAVALCCGQWAACAPSGLNVIPTTDVLGNREISLEAESDGRGQPWGDDCTRLLLFQIGLGNGFEAGIDHCLDDPELWLNVKWRLQDESTGRPAVACGIQGISNNESAQPYLAIHKSVGSVRLHTGLIVIDRKTRWMGGIDRPLGNRITLQADYINGSENAFTYGVGISLSKNLSLTLGRAVGNSEEIGNGYIVNLACSLHL